MDETALLDPALLPTILSTLSNAFRDGDWRMVSGLALTLVMVFARQLAPKLPAEYVPWATIGMSMLTSIGLGLQRGESWSTMLVTGFSVGVVAVGGWETLGKLVRGAWRKLRGQDHA